MNHKFIRISVLIGIGVLLLSAVAIASLVIQHQSEVYGVGAPTVQIVQTGPTNSPMLKSDGRGSTPAEPSQSVSDEEVDEVIKMLITPIAMPTNALTKMPMAFSCPGAPQSRLIGQTGGRSTQGGLPLRVRASPGKNGKFLGNLKNGESFQILDGPSCQNGMVWWKISANVEGWVAEGDSKQYYIEPR